MAVLSVLGDYILWHYSRGFIDLFGVVRNYLWFIGHLFSVSTLLQTLFSPFKRIAEEQERGILSHPQAFLENVLINTIMRLVGFSVRFAMIAMAIAGWIVVASVGILLCVLWFILPFLVPYFVIRGFLLLI